MAEPGPPSHPTLRSNGCECQGFVCTQALAWLLSHPRPWSGAPAGTEAASETGLTQDLFPHSPSAECFTQWAPALKHRCPWMAGNPSTLLPRPEPWGGGPPGSEHLVSLGCHWVLPSKDGCTLGSRLGESHPNNTCLLLLALSPVPRAAPGTQKALRKSLLT